MDSRVCIKCEILYPLEDKYFALVNKNGTRRVTVCRECRKAYDKQYRDSKKEQQEEVIEEMYTIKELTQEEKNQLLAKAYAHIHMQAFGKPIPQWKLKEIEGIEE